MSSWKEQGRPSFLLSSEQSGDQLAVLLRTVEFASFKHRQQKRKDADGTPYIQHPVGVASLIANVGQCNDLEILQAALLHDTVEDTDTSFEELELNFGANVTQLVRHVTDQKGLPKLERKRLQVEHAKQAPYGAKMVKLADKLYNLRDLVRCIPASWTVWRAQGYFVWSHAVVEQLAGTNAGLEKALQAVFAEEICMADGQKVPALPSGDLKQHLASYYELIERVQKGESD
eukprot:m.46087 g.46087  ORF g.46087 m.46087 type:complete len:231 (-) comp14731_c0_seq1:134-826(-)